MAISIRLRPDSHNDPLVSATFVLHKVPTASESLGSLVERAVVALDFVVADESAGLVASSSVSLVRLESTGQTVVAEQTSTDPFGQVALHLDVEDDTARQVFESMLGIEGPLSLLARVTPATTTAATTRVGVDLGKLREALVRVAGDDLTFYRIDLINYLPMLRAAGAVTVEGDGPAAEAGPIVDALVSAARWVLKPSSSTEGAQPTWTLVVDGPAPIGMTASATTNSTVPPATGPQVAVPLHSLIPGAIRHDPQRFVHLVGVSGGALDAILPVQRRARGARREQLLALGGSVSSLGNALQQRPSSTLVPLAAGQITSHSFDRLSHISTLDLTLADQRTGPIVNDGPAPFWADRWNKSLAWYAPGLVVALPDPSQPVEVSPFRFDLRSGVGHAADGRPLIEATIKITIRRQALKGDLDAAIAAGRTEHKAIQPTESSYQLAIPFRDEHGESRVELMSSTSVQLDGDLVVLSFGLANNWARLTYGALSTPGFQSEPARLIVTSTFEGWQPTSDGFSSLNVLGLHKRRSLTPLEKPGPARSPRADRAPLNLHTSTLVTAQVQPAWSISPELLDSIRRTKYSWSRFVTTKSVDVSLPCAEFGEAYRELVDGVDSRAIGCRPALQLGEIEYRTYEKVEVIAAAGVATIYRSLRSPGRYLVVPNRYTVGRFEPGSQREYQPTLLLHSTIDVDSPTNIRCVLAAALEPELPRFTRDAILAELRATAHPSPALEYLPDAGVVPTVSIAAPHGAEVDCVPTRDGFQLVVTTDIPGFLTLRSLLQRVGLRGSVSLGLPGGVGAQSDLVLTSKSATGPFDAGPLKVLRDKENVVVSNPTGQRIALTGFMINGDKIADAAVVVPPAESITVPAPVQLGELVPIYAVEEGSGSIEELRSYVEDLDIGVMFVATADPASAGFDRLEIETVFLGHADPAPLVLTAEIRELERSFTLPLTEFVADPTVQFTVHGIAPDGSRRSSPPATWAMRTQGALIPVQPPA